MELSGNTVQFHLNARGQSDLGRMVSKKGSFQAVVLGADTLGAWILFPGLSSVPATGKVPVMLLKWEYISMAVFEFQPGAPPSKEGMGFVPGSRRN